MARCALVAVVLCGVSPTAPSTARAGASAVALPPPCPPSMPNCNPPPALPPPVSPSRRRPCKTCKKPQHSWATLPVFWHSSDPSGPRGGFTDAELQVLAKFPLITLEKWQGSSVQPFMTQEEAWLVAARQLKAINPNITIIVWYDSTRIYRVNATNNGDYHGDCGGQGHMHWSHYLYTHPEYLVKNRSGLPAVDDWAHCHIYDFTQRRVQEFWTDMCLNMTSSGLIDGCGADDSWTQAYGGLTKFNLAPDVQARWDVGHRTMLRDTTLALGDGLLMGNSYPLQELGYAVNGILQEGCSWNDNGGFNATIGTLRKMARDAAATPRFGSGFAGPLVFECHTRCCTSLCSLPNNQTIGCEDTAAAFLIGAGSDHYFGTGEWADGARLTSDYILGLMDVPLGEPDGEAVYDPAGTLWTRTFGGGVAAGGTTVTVNVSVHNQSGSIWRAHGQPAEFCASMLRGMCGAARVVNASSCEQCIETNASPLYKAGCTRLDRSMTKAWCSKTMYA